MLAETLPDPIDTVMFLNSGSEAIDGALKLARRVTGRPGIVAFRGGFHGRTFGATSVTTSNINYRTGYEPLLPGVYFAPFPAAYRDFDGDDAAASAACLADPRIAVHDGDRAVDRRGDPHRAGPGRGRLLPRPAGVPARPPRDLRRARDPADRRRGPDRLRPDRADVGLRARRDRPRRRHGREGDRERPAALGDRDQPRAAGALGPERPRLDVRRQSRRLRGRDRGPRDDRGRGPRLQRRDARRRADARGCTA